MCAHSEDVRAHATSAGRSAHTWMHADVCVRPPQRSSAGACGAHLRPREAARGQGALAPRVSGRASPAARLRSRVCGRASAVARRRTREAARGASAAAQTSALPPGPDGAPRALPQRSSRRPPRDGRRETAAARARRPYGACQREAPDAAARKRAASERGRENLGAGASARSRAALPPPSRRTAAQRERKGGRARGARRRRGREKVQRRPARTPTSSIIACEIGEGSEHERCVGGSQTHHPTHHTTSDREAGARTAGSVPKRRSKDAHLKRRREHGAKLALSSARAFFTDWGARRDTEGHNLRSERRTGVGGSGRRRARS